MEGATEIEKETWKEVKNALKEILKPGDSIWGIDLNEAFKEERTLESEKADLVLLKFVRASDLNAPNAVERIQNTLKWRSEFNMEKLIEEKFSENFGEAGFLHKTDLHGRPIMYNLYGIHQEIFEDLNCFIRWRVQLMEQGVSKLSFPQIDSMIQIHDYEGVSMFSSTSQTKAAAKEAVKIFGDHYPELLAKKFFINVPWYLSGFYNFLQPIIPTRTSQKFVICSSDFREKMLELIPVEHIPVKYGGLSRMGSEKLAIVFPAGIEQEKAKKIVVDSRTFHAEEVSLPGPSTLYWEFVLVDDDIEFACTFVEKEGGKLANVEAVKKVGIALQVGKFEAAAAGTLKFVWDNSFSIFTSKTLHFRFLIVPSA